MPAAKSARWTGNEDSSTLPSPLELLPSSSSRAATPTVIANAIACHGRRQKIAATNGSET